MIVIHLSGGLGNQLFQYTFGVYLKEKFNQEVKFDESGFKFNSSRKKEITIIAPNINIYNDNKIFTNYQGILYRVKLFLFKIKSQNKYINDSELFKSNGVLDTSLNYYFDGYWQTDYYYSKLKSSNDLFKPKEPIPKLIENYCSEIEKNTAVSLHIRRGDYFTPQYIDRYGVCTVEYYLCAIAHIRKNIENPKFYIFSDDLEWVKENIELPNDSVFIENVTINSYWYIYLMSKCKHNIISNSTFSWWGAQLNMNIDKMVLSPNKWMLDSNETIALEDWVKIEVR